MAVWRMRFYTVAISTRAKLRSTSSTACGGPPSPQGEGKEGLWLSADKVSHRKATSNIKCRKTSPTACGGPPSPEGRAWIGRAQNNFKP